MPNYVPSKTIQPLFQAFFNLKPSVVWQISKWNNLNETYCFHIRHSTYETLFKINLFIKIIY